MNKMLKHIERVGNVKLHFIFPCYVPMKKYITIHKYENGDVYYSANTNTEMIQEIMSWEIPFLCSSGNLYQVYRNYGHGFYFSDIPFLNKEELTDFSAVEKSSINKFKLLNTI